jgi:transcriptional regulator with XRE-family HTH domain
MKLKEYLALKNIKITTFAKKIDYSVTHLSRISLGKSIPSERLARIISEATNGKVKIEDLCPTNVITFDAS